MSAPVFLVDDLAPLGGGRGEDQLLLQGAEGRHAATVRRLRPGERLDLCDGRGGRAACVVAEVGAGSVRCTVLRREQEPAPQPRLVVVQALAKGDRGELAVELATEVGVDELVPWAAARSVVRWDGPRGERALERWRATAREAAKQARRSWLPEVSALRTTPQLAQRWPAARAEAPVRVLVLHEQAEQRLAAVDLAGVQEVVLVVGPEGGVDDAELAQIGGLPVRLGPTVLRTSSAGAAAAAVVQVLSGRW